jgi:hypothetical protein
VLDFVFEILSMGEMFFWLRGDDAGGGSGGLGGRVLTVLLIILAAAAVVCFGMREWLWGGVCAILAVLTLVAIHSVSKAG